MVGLVEDDPPERGQYARVALLGGSFDGEVGKEEVVVHHEQLRGSDLPPGFVEETADEDLPNVGTFNDVKAKWASKNNKSWTYLGHRRYSLDELRNNSPKPS